MKKSLTAIGDSIVWGDGNQGISWVDYVEETGVFEKVIKNGINGSTYSNNSEGFYTRVDATEIGDVTVLLGGINDYNRGIAIGQLGDYNPDTVLGGAQLLLEHIKKKNPQTDIYLCMPMNSSYYTHADKYQDSNEKNPIGYVLDDYRAALQLLAIEYNCKVIDLNKDTDINPLDEVSFTKYNCGDGLHPNDVGYRHLADVILKHIC